MSISKKYCRSLHAQISLGTTSDDRFMPNGYVKVFSQFQNLVVTEKLDGQNNCLNKHGVFARSHAAPSQLPWDKPLKDRWELLKNDLGNLEIFGENMYGIHSIAYSKLESYFYVFAVRENGIWLSWEEVKFYAAMLDFPTVPEIQMEKTLKDFYQGNKDENEIFDTWLTENLEMSWVDYTNTSGKLGGFNPENEKPCSEGFVIRNANAFKTNNGILPVAPNEFDSLCKLVRPAHVKTDVHWIKNWKPASLVNYEKYKWFNFSYLTKK
ncbi:RNA ligase family protein [Aureivirga sp. CE67]|uniref:RNA ligase family protein n=1 Tax=Aureivirga sp. CE67 TaxID=1788983 RepID=UPI0018CACAC1|nr:RNA ligase family protein [Aureivirga sp. CE67]